MERIAVRRAGVADLNWIKRMADRHRAEVGFVLRAALAGAHGLRLSDVLAANLDKLRRRYPQGFTTAASIARADEPQEGTNA